MMRLWHDSRFLSIAANLLLLLALGGLAHSALGWFGRQPYFEIRQVQIGALPGSALRHVNQPALYKTIRSVSYGNFFSIDMQGLKERVETVPWVRHATVRRLWPDTLVVQIEEHRPAALWQDGRLISIYGELFAANLDEAEEDRPLPQLGGPAGTEKEVIKRYTELRNLLEPLRLEPVAVSLSMRRAWTAKLDDGTELLLGRDRDVTGTERVPVAERVARWVESYPLVTERLQRLASIIDLRYPNGYTVRSLDQLAEAFSIDDLITDATARDAAITNSAPTSPAAAGVKGQTNAGRKQP